MICIVAYDIENDKVRARLSRFLEKEGRRLQKSVFAVEVERHVFGTFTRKLEGYAGGAGRVAVFRLCAGCERNALQIAGEDEPRFHVF